MNERIFHFGPDDGLVGVLTLPPAGLRQPATPTVLLLNAGLIAHIGPFCWYVTLARRLAERGFSVLRLDLAGLGDSNHRGACLGEIDRAVQDVREALDTLASRQGTQQFVVGGLCSGAMYAHHVAIADPRITGVFWLDGYGYRTPGYYWRHYCRRLFQPQVWWQLLRRLWRGQANDLAAEMGEPEYFRAFPPREQLRAELLQLVQRQVRQLFLFTGGLEYLFFNHRHQFEEMFGVLDPSGRVLEVEYHEQADHLYTHFADRERLFAHLVQWLEQGWSPRRSGRV